jgi:HEAT repeat protein
MKFKEEARVAVPGMIDCVRNGTEDLPERAARALAEMEAKESIPVIVAAMKGRRIQIMSAVLVLHRLGYEAKEAVPQLCQELKGRNRIGAAQCLSLISSAHSKVAIPDLMGMLGSKESRERSAAVAALASMGPDAAPAIPKLVQAAGDEWYFVRDAAIQALGKIGPAAKEALPVLAKALNDPNPNVAGSARASISQIDPKALPEGAAKRMRTPSPKNLQARLKGLHLSKRYGLGVSRSFVLSVARIGAHGERHRCAIAARCPSL